MSDTSGSPASGRETADVYADAATRLERVVDAQRNALDEVDTRAMAVMRLVVALLGVVATLLSVAATLDGLPDPSSTTLLSFALGVSALGGTLLAAVATYLGNRVVPGIGPGVADDLLDASVDETVHLRRVVAAYADAVRANRAALAVNARRFRLTLLLLLTGIAYGTVAALAFAFTLDGLVGGLLLVLPTVTLAVAWWYVLTGRYLTETDVGDGAVVTTVGERDHPAYPLAVIDRGDE